MKVALIKETKDPVDNRVALSPIQVANLNKQFPDHQIVVQSSAIRCFSDEMYRSLGIEVIDDVSDCDILFGIKEAKIESLIPDKQYFFFGHIAKMQEYNRPLLQAFIRDRITFCDYEYLVDDTNQRVCAFGWWAGVVGVYYTLRGYGIKHHLYELPAPDRYFTLDRLLDALMSVSLPSVKVFITGAGRVSQGAQFVLERIGAIRLSEEEFLTADAVEHLSFCSANVDRLVRRKDGKPFSRSDFAERPDLYESDFSKWACQTDILVSAHFWRPVDPVYLPEEDLRRSDMRIKMIGDVTCDIKGSIKSTIRSSTHDDPFYDFKPLTGKEEPAFSSDRNISVMAVDTCPNALALDTSEYFGNMLTEYVFEPLLKGEPSAIIDRSMIVRAGKLTTKFEYLKDFAEGK